MADYDAAAQAASKLDMSGTGRLHQIETNISAETKRGTNSFRMLIYGMTLNNSLRMNTYKKQGEGSRLCCAIAVSTVLAAGQLRTNPACHILGR